MNIKEIQSEITKLEKADTTWASIQKLSWLYIVRNNAMQNTKTETLTVEKFPKLDGEFGAAISEKDISAVMPILSEHMAVVKILIPKEYKAVIEQIKNAT